jgi:hypothetical protein
MSSGRNEVAVLLPLLAPTRLTRMEKPARMLADHLLREGIGVAMRPALGSDMERRRTCTASLAVTLAAVEILAGTHLLGLCTLAMSSDLVTASLLGNAMRLHLDGEKSLLLGTSSLLLSDDPLLLGRAESGESLFLPEEKEIAKADIKESRLLKDIERVKRISALALTDLGPMRLREIRGRVNEMPGTLGAIPVAVLPCRLRRAAGAGVRAIGVLKDEVGGRGHHIADCDRRRHFH